MGFGTGVTAAAAGSDSRAFSSSRVQLARDQARNQARALAGNERYSPPGDRIRLHHQTAAGLY